MNRILTRDQRETLWRDVTDLILRPEFDDMRDLQGGDAEHWSQRYCDALRLLDDLGWRRIDPRDRYVLTMPDRPLERILRWMQRDAEDAVRLRSRLFGRAERAPIGEGEWERRAAAARRRIDHELDVHNVCSAVLGVAA